MNRLLILLCAVLASCQSVDSVRDEQSPSTGSAYESVEARDARMAWWRDARFGMFIHWGLYAVPAGAWERRTNHGEWIRTTAEIPLAVYDQFREQFNPVAFDAKAWAALAHDAGMRYVTITTKHHDGFCLFDSAQTDFDIMNTPFRRDVMTELSEAVRSEGLAMCWYHSIMDWHHPDYLPRRPWEKDRPSAGADMGRFVDYLESQVTELLTKYGPIGVMWFDGEWESTWNHQRGQALYDLCRRLQPSVIVNNRVDVGRGGMAGQTRAGAFAGDYGTPEQEVPATGMPGVDWETCMTMGGHWGWNAAETKWKSTEELIRTLCDVASKGGNFLLNVGPKADGTFPEAAIDRLKGIGAWMKVNGDSIHGTQASLLDSFPAGRSTTKYAPDGSVTIYLHLFDMPNDRRVFVPQLGEVPRRASVLGGPTVVVEPSSNGVTVVVPSLVAASSIPVVVLKYDQAPTIYRTPTISADSTMFVDTVDVTIPPMSGVDIRVTFDGREPSALGIVGPGIYRIDHSSVVQAQGFRHGKAVTSIASRSFNQVSARPSDTTRANASGLVCDSWLGEWKRLPDFATLGTPIKSEILRQPTHGNPAREHMARRFTGFVDVPVAGVYSFEVTSDDGSVLWIGETKVVDHDGLHQVEPRSGQIALSKGKHKVTIGHFNASGGEWLEVRWARPGFGFEPIGESAWTH